CFAGNFRVSPVVMAFVDSAILFAAGYWYVESVSVGYGFRASLILSDLAFGAAFVIFLFLFSSSVVATSMAVRQPVKPPAIELSPDDLISLGVTNQGETRVVKISVRNNDSSPIRLIGGSSTCHCVAQVGLPITVPAQSSSEIEASRVSTLRDSC